ncbi:MAG: hypothetical protein D6691_02275 [Candidatus Hydrogenedentota bacterium]|nr:MAG: hypothetical protein D6691_02275 [Candidatus Hydrogenedentota bacterium]
MRLQKSPREIVVLPPVLSGKVQTRRSSPILGHASVRVVSQQIALAVTRNLVSIEMRREAGISFPPLFIRSGVLDLQDPQIPRRLGLVE